LPSSPDPRRERVLLAALLPTAFAISALREPRALGVAWAVALVLLARGAPAALRRTLRVVAPLTLGLSAASWAFLAVAAGGRPPVAPFLALALRTTLVAFLTFSVLARVSLLRALAPWPAASRLAALTLAQIHALRRLQAESAEGLRSRLPRRPRVLDVLRNAGGLTAALLSLAVKNAREAEEAMRSRGF
jgi:cobalt/nickel transport system permease protein